MKALLRFILRLLYRVEVEGLDNLPAPDAPCMIIANHVSYIDGLLLHAFLPGNLHFALRPEDHPLLARLGLATLLVPDQPDRMRELIKRMHSGKERLVAFPEGLPSATGRLAKIYASAGMLADRVADSTYVVVHIAGPELGRDTRRRRPVGRWFPRTRITISKPQHHAPPEDLRGSRRRRWHEMRIRKMLEDAAFASERTDLSLPAFLVACARKYGMGQVVCADFGPPPRRLTYRTLLRASFALGPKLGAAHPAGARVGVMLPTSAGAVAVFHACQFAGIVPVMLNFSAPSGDVISACRTAEVDTVYTAQRLLDRLETARKHVEAMREAGIKVVMLEDVRESLGLADKLRALGRSLAPASSLLSEPMLRAKPDAPGIVLFTSGSEGPPKGVVLTQRNLIANALQVMARIAAGPGDVLFNALPLFHSTGVIVGITLPIASGFAAQQYPSPLHFSAIPELILSSGATIMISTSTFYGQYARMAHANDMEPIEQAYAGGEKLREAVSATWLRKFGKRIHEAYGVTEASPALAACSPWVFEPGSVGPLLPGIEARLRPVAGVDEGGKLLVRGPNVMAGWLLASAPGELQPPADGWHDTGDIVAIDEFGFVRIVGRAKRFAKIAGEMVPLGRIEEELDSYFGESLFAVVAVPDEQRGEQVVLVTTKEDADLASVRSALAAAGASELWVPRRVLHVRELPMLATGKPNHPAIGEMAAAMCEQPEPDAEAS